MATINEQLDYIDNCKVSIKNAIEAKGVTVGDATLDEYPNKIAAISSGGGTGLIEQAFIDAGKEYLIHDFLIAINRTIAMTPTGSMDDLIINNNSGGAVYVDGAAPPSANKQVNYQKGLISVRNVDFSNWVFTNTSGRQFAFNVNMVQFDGVATAASGVGYTDFSGVTQAVMMFSNDLLLEDIKLYLPNALNVSSLMTDCTNLKTASLKVSPTTAIPADYMFNRCGNLTEVEFPNGLVCSTIKGLFFFCNALTKCSGVIDITNVSDYAQFLDGSGAKNIEEVYVKGLNNSITVSSPNIKKECILYLFDNALTVTGSPYISLNNSVYTSLTSDEIAVATGKGYTVRGGLIFN